MKNGHEDLWRRENPNFSEFTQYNRFSGTRSRIDKVFTNIKIATNNKINHIIVSFTGYYNAVSLERLPSKTKSGKD